MITLTTCRKFWADVRNGRIYSPEDGDPTFTQRIKRIRCWWRGYHVYDSYDVPICNDCGKVGTGISLEDGE